MRRLCFFLFLIILVQPSLADNNLTFVSTWQRIGLFEGPGITYWQTGWLNAGVEVTLLERNVAGTWVHVQRVDTSGDILLDGWVMSAFFNLPDDFDFGSLPVSSLPDADIDNVNSQSMSQLFSVPVIPEISLAMQEVYQRGVEAGNHPNVITKVGDSLMQNDEYLQVMSQPNYDLGGYVFLTQTVEFYRESAGQPSVAARLGLTTYVVFDPMWADPAQCEAGESPLNCEYRLKRPSVALIMFGANDVQHMTDAIFDEQMRLLVEETLAQNIIPVLFTFSYHPDNEFWWQAINFNLRLVQIASDYEVPLVNLWSAARALPEFGLDVDRIHLKNSGVDWLDFTNGREARYGVTLQNLLTIRVLHEIRRSIPHEIDSPDNATDF